MREATLFAAYRTATGYAAPCACGGTIEAHSRDTIKPAVVEHYDSRRHREWAAVEDLRRPTRHRCPCHAGQEVEW